MRFVLTALLLWPMTAQAGFSYDNYDDCMLGKMKGQSSGMWVTADKECKRQFKVIFSLPTPPIKWSFETERGVTIVTITDGDQYEVTSAEFTFSEKPCADAKADDFRPPAVLDFMEVRLLTTFPYGLCFAPTPLISRDDTSSDFKT